MLIVLREMYERRGKCRWEKQSPNPESREPSPARTTALYNSGVHDPKNGSNTTLFIRPPGTDSIWATTCLRGKTKPGGANAPPG